jgi:hypothetical protein
MSTTTPKQSTPKSDGSSDKKMYKVTKVADVTDKPRNKDLPFLTEKCFGEKVVKFFEAIMGNIKANKRYPANYYLSFDGVDAVKYVVPEPVRPKLKSSPKKVNTEIDVSTLDESVDPFDEIEDNAKLEAYKKLLYDAEKAKIDLVLCDQNALALAEGNMSDELIRIVCEDAVVKKMFDDKELASLTKWFLNNRRTKVSETLQHVTAVSVVAAADAYGKLRMHEGEPFASFRKRVTDTVDAYECALKLAGRSAAMPTAEEQIVKVMNALNFSVPATEIRKKYGLDEIKESHVKDLQSFLKYCANTYDATPSYARQQSEQTFYKNVFTASKKPGKCHFCGKPGHWKFECKSRKNKEGKDKESDDLSKAVASEKSKKHLN